MKVGQYISELLYQHESVLLPGFGTFTTKYEPARFIPEQKIVQAPALIVAFNPMPKDGDTVLVDYISEKEGKSSGEIMRNLGELVQETIHALEAGNKVELECIGLFAMEGDGSLLFEPNRHINYLANNTGITHVKTPEQKPVKDTLVAATVVKTPTPKTEEKEFSETPKKEDMSEPKPKETKDKSALSPALRWIAIILIPLLIILLILFFNYTFFFGTEGLFRKAPPVYIEETVVSPDTDLVAEPDVVEEATADTYVPTTEDAYDPYLVPPAPDFSRPVYLIVVGSFRNELKANKLALELRKGGAPMAHVLDRTHAGFYRTYYGYYYDLNKAKEQKALLSDEMKEIAWILHR